MSRVIVVITPFNLYPFERMQLLSLGRSIAIHGDIPIIPAIYFGEILDLEQEYEFDLASVLSEDMIQRCDEVWIRFNRIDSPVINNLINAAQKAGKPVSFG